MHQHRDNAVVHRKQSCPRCGSQPDEQGTVLLASIEGRIKWDASLECNVDGYSDDLGKAALVAGHLM